MKKSTRMLLSLLGRAVSMNTFGQTDNFITSIKTSHAAAETDVYAPSPSANIATSVVEEGFAKYYPQARDAKWSRLENGFHASFTDKGRKTTAAFDDQGKFSYAISELSADKIPAEVSSFIKKEYPGYKLIRAVSIRDNVKTVCQTIIQQNNSYVKIKSIGEDLEVSIIQNRPNAQ